MAAALEVGAPVQLNESEKYMLRAFTEAMEKQGTEFGGRLEDALKRSKSTEEQFGKFSAEVAELRSAIKERGIKGANGDDQGDDVPRRERGTGRNIAGLVDAGRDQGVIPSREGGKEAQIHRIGAAAVALARFKGDEDAAADQLRKRGLADVIPLIHRGEREAMETKARAGLSTLSEGAGGSLIPAPQLYQNDFIDFLRPRVVFRKAGVASIPMPTGEIDIGRQNGTATVTWVEETTPPNATSPSVGRTKLVARQAIAIVPLSNNLIRRSIPSAEMIAQRDLVRAVAVEEDVRFLRGTGASSTPKGVRNLTTNTINAATGGTTPTFAQVVSDITKMINQVASSNVSVDPSECGFIMCNRTKWGWAHAQDGVGRTPFLEMLATALGNENFLGFKVFATEQVPNNLGGGSNEAEVYFGNFGELYIGDTLSFQMEMSREAAYNDSSGTLQAAFSRDETVMRIVHEVDITARYTTAWSVINQSTAV
jgi:HK97 family phage major capsid protein